MKHLKKTSQMFRHICTVMILLFILKVTAQRQRPEESSLGLYTGTTVNGYGALANYNYHVKRNSFIQGGLYFSFNEEKTDNTNITIPFNIFSFQLGYLQSSYLSKLDDFKISYGAGGLLGYEVINNGKEELSTGALIVDETQFILGFFGTIELEYSLNDDWSIIGKYNQYYHINSDLGEFTPFIGIGLRFYPFF